MVVLLVLTMILAFLTIDYFVQRAAVPSALRSAVAATPVEVPRAASAGGLEPERIPSGVFVSPGHVWMRIEPEGTVLVGVDPLLVSLLGGGIEHVYAMEEGREVEQGGPLVMLRRGSRALKVRSPVAGRVSAVNPDTRNAPGRLAESPFDGGWIYRIRPLSLYESLGHSVVGRDAVKFLRRESNKLKDLLEELSSRGETPVAVAADGGTPLPDAADRIGDVEWEELVSRFFAGAPRSEATLLTFRSRDGAGGV